MAACNGDMGCIIAAAIATKSQATASGVPTEVITAVNATLTTAIVSSFTKTLDACKDDACIVAAATAAASQASASGTSGSSISTEIINAVTDSGADPAVIKAVTEIVTNVSPNN